MNRPTRIFIIAGEDSGDVHAANLIKAIREKDPNTAFEGLGGARMASAGVRLLRNTVEDFAIIGFADVFRRFPELRALFRSVIHRLKTHRPDALLLVDYPGFNLRIARQAKKLGIPVIYYICPQTWAWHQSRAKAFPKILDHMMTIFPFEEGLFRSYGAKATFVGHPLLDLLQITKTREQTCKIFNLDPGRPILSLLPGSRGSEIHSLLPVMLEAGKKLRKKHPEVQFVLPKAESVRKETLEQIAERYDLPFLIADTERYNLRAASDFAWVASGTATLETALLGVPMIILYRTHWFTYALGKRLVSLSHIGLPNIVAEKEIVPELIQDHANADLLSRKTIRLLEDPERMQEIKNALQQVRQKLHCPANGNTTSYQRAAEVFLAQLQKTAQI